MKDAVSSTLRKARSDAWWAALPEEEAWEIFEKRRRLPWHAVAKWLRESKGLDVSRRALERFEAWMRPQAAGRRMALSVLARDEAKELATAVGAGTDVAKAFIAMGTEVGLRTEDPEAASAWIKMAASLLEAARKDAELRLREEAQKTAAGQLALAREKFEAAEKREAAAKSALGDGTLSDADRTARLKEIFGIG